MTDRPLIVWFRQDLRIADNPALHRASRNGSRLVCVYVHEDDDPAHDDVPAPRPLGGAARWWLHRSLLALDGDLRAIGGRLLLLKGPAAREIPALARRIGAGAVLINRVYDPEGAARDRAIGERLKADGIHMAGHNALLLHEPWTIETKTGGPYQVFTPFWRAARDKGEIPPPLAAPDRLDLVEDAPEGVPLAALDLLPRIDWAGGIAASWTPGSAGARDRLAGFLNRALTGYKPDRDRPAGETTSRLSPHLRFGEIGPRTVWHAVHHAIEAQGLEGPARASADTFLTELGWREFSYHLLHHFPHLPARDLKETLTGFPWREDAAALDAWQRGRTGYPIVDAGMRQLWHTGWMHNRVRMVVASFLVKHLMIWWKPGEAWFWDTLVDADPASNTASWQWSAGTGADAAPYFRIFNPVLQGERFDGDGAYVRRWVPELAKLPDRYLHKPWTAPASVLATAGIRPGQTYPAPIVDHDQARERALAGYARTRKE
ncbi:deoxyribodipyrimidine photo-lyase [Tistrella mobilis]|uniref:cryptochrome/photolyase family protein n=1 Tax=Tistrella mobilis TaxID=171437 RepID=UPI003556C90C